jgi:hypothetical protein
VEVSTVCIPSLPSVLATMKITAATMTVATTSR